MSVLICTHNRPQYLPEALRSIFSQTYTNFEVILTRDGGCAVNDVVSEFASDERLIFVDRNENKGKAWSLNRAVERARGTYLCYLDDDDAWYPHHIETLVGALEGQERFGAAYSDLYKAHCRYLSGDRRLVLAKNVEISRDFDKLVLLQFNLALHVSVMHRKDLLERAGGYNEQLNVLIDWDLTRRLCFYTDFVHVPVVTGQYYAPVGDCDRISVRRRRNVSDYLRNLLTIRSTRPPKPWNGLEDMDVFVMAGQCGQGLEQTLGMLWAQCFYPRRHFVVLPEAEAARFRTPIPGVMAIGVPSHSSACQCIESILNDSDAAFAAVVPVGMRTERDEVAFLERSLKPLLDADERGVAYELPESNGGCWGAVMRKEDLLGALRAGRGADLRSALAGAGIRVQKPEFSQYPFQFDHFLTMAGQIEQGGDWLKAASVYAYLAEHFGNGLWMRTLKANALFHAGRWRQAAQTAHELNREHPTAARLLIEARAYRKLNQFEQAIGCYQAAQEVLEGRTLSEKITGFEPVGQGVDYGVADPAEKHKWTH